jgi:hypothetical protein
MMSESAQGRAADLVALITAAQFRFETDLRRPTPDKPSRVIISGTHGVPYRSVINGVQ